MKTLLWVGIICHVLLTSAQMGLAFAEPYALSQQEIDDPSDTGDAMTALSHKPDATSMAQDEPQLCRQCRDKTMIIIDRWHQTSEHRSNNARHGVDTCDSCRLIDTAVRAYQASRQDLDGKQWELPNREWERFKVLVRPSFADPGTQSYISSAGNFLAALQGVMQWKPPIASDESDGQVTLEITTTPGEVFPLKGFPQVHEVLHDPGSLESFEHMREEIHHCVTNHTKCNHISKERPQRLLEIDPSSDRIKLVSGALTHGPYCAVTHAWAAADQAHYELNSTSYERYTQDFNVKDWPAAYQDAVNISSAANCQYLWIDSLCMLQDNATEIKAEKRRWHHIYGNAHLVIAASTSRTPEQAILQSRPSSVTFTFDYHGTIYNATIGPPIRHPWAQHESVDAPILSDPWAFQARLLANRVVNFGADETTWECKTNTHCECGMLDFYDTLPSRRWRPARNHSSIKTRLAEHLETDELGALPADSWYDIVDYHMACNFQNDSDRLGALAPLAEVVSAKMPDTGKYLAGMWSSHLPDALDWGGYYQAPELPYIGGPTWSWASYRGSSQSQGNPIGRSMELLETNCSSSMAGDSYVDFEDCSLLLEAKFLVVPGHDGEEDCPAIVLDIPDWDMLRVMILKPSTKVLGAFERVGPTIVGDDLKRETMQIRLV